MILEHYSKNKKIPLIVFFVFLVVGILILLYPYFSSSNMANTTINNDSVNINNDFVNINNNPVDNLWATTTNNDGIKYQYPKELLAKYISVVEWPPVIKIETGTYSCETTPPEVSSASDATTQVLVNDRTYCVNVRREGAAGSVFSSYTYTTNKNNQLINVSFTLRYPNCDNYDEEQSKACASERESFDIDSMVDKIIQTIK